VLQLTVAGILPQTLFFKFTGAEESVYIFRPVGQFLHLVLDQSSTAPTARQRAPRLARASCGGRHRDKRFLPGARLPLYVLAGILGSPGSVFAAWALVGTLLWTPALVLVTACLGDAFAGPVSLVVGIGWAPQVLIALGVLSLLHLLRSMDWRRVRTAGWFCCSRCLRYVGRDRDPRRRNTKNGSRLAALSDE
jgi:hypothetical protein